jgi:putative endonuclease
MKTPGRNKQNWNEQKNCHPERSTICREAKDNAQPRDLVFCFLNIKRNGDSSNMREYRFYVYILQSASRRALYIGITNNLRHRVFQHKTHQFEGFTDDYNAVRLVYWEKFGGVGNAIAREKQLKRWRREKKIWLIERMNPTWSDLAADWYRTQGTASSA